MRADPDLYRLTFLVPKGASVPDMRPRREGPQLAVDHGQVTIDGRSREAVFACCCNFIRTTILPQLRTPVQAAALLESPGRHTPDGWNIIIGADIAFSPTSLDADLGELRRARRATNPTFDNVVILPVQARR